jgi:hypothetical protein
MIRGDTVLLAAVLVAASGCSTISSGPGSLAARREVTASRLLSRETDAAVAQNRLRSLRESVSCDGGVALHATLFTDPSGIARKYVLEGESADSVESLFYYYDTAGRLRLITTHQRGGKNARRTARLYFDAGGKVVHRDEQRSGPDWTFAEAGERRDPASDIRSLADPDRGCRKARN